MTNVRDKLEALNAQCEQLCEEQGWQSPKSKSPNFRLIYTSVETFERGNGYAIVGINPAGTTEDADRDSNRETPFTTKGYSAYLDDDWEGGRGQSKFQRAVQGVAMILNGTDSSEAIEAIREKVIEPEKRLEPNVIDFLRGTPSLNIIPFRTRSVYDLNRNLPLNLQERGEEIGWELLCLIRPKPRYIVALANGQPSPWSTILRNSHQPPGDFERTISRRRGHRGPRTYREVKLTSGPLEGALVFGLPAVVRDDIDDEKEREEVTKPLFQVVRERLMHHNIVG